jgi:2-aminoadipate transaminase
MADGQTFNYEKLFARNVPDPAPMRVIERAKYDFAIAYPDPSSIPTEALAQCIAQALAEEGKDLAVYPHEQGYPPLREYVTMKLARDRGIETSSDNVFLADGSSQPNHMLIEALVDPGDVVLTEDFVYSGTLRTLSRFRADVRGIACDDDGMLPNALDYAIAAATADGKHPKLIYTIPTFQNPQGLTMSLERRQAMLDIASRHGIAIIEDDCYVDLRYSGENVPSIMSLDNDGIVNYVGSFSKITGPGMRIGYLTASDEMMERLRPIKSGGGVNQFAAWAIHRYALKYLDDHIREVNDIQRIKRDAMLAALGENFGSSAKWSQPDGALYIWFEMPEHTDLFEAQEAASHAEVGYQAGPIFTQDGVSGKNYARLCYGYNTPYEIREGIGRLAEVFDKKGFLGK